MKVYPATEPAFCSLIRQCGRVYLTPGPIKMMDAVRTSIKLKEKFIKPTASGGKLQSFTVPSFVMMAFHVLLDTTLKGGRGDTLCCSCSATQQEFCHCPFVLVWLGGQWRDQWEASR